MSTKNPLFNDFGLTVARLEEALRLEKNGIVRDSAIKRFELCFDLAWKCMQIYARKEGVECHSPRGCLKTAFQLGLLEYDEVWMEMLEDLPIPRIRPCQSILSSARSRSPRPDRA